MIFASTYFYEQVIHKRENCSHDPKNLVYSKVPKKEEGSHYHIEEEKE